MDIKWMRRVSNQTIFPLKVYKWSVLNWEEKKQKLLDLVDFSEEKETSLSPFTDLHKTNGRPNYFDQWYEILRDDFKDAFEEPVSIWQDQNNPEFNLQYAQEGDIFVFPSILLHDLPVTMSDKPKTIQTFNVPLIFPGQGTVSPRDQLVNLNDTSQNS